MSEQRTIRFSVRSVLTVIGLVVATWALLTMVPIARHVIVWILVSIFLALALNPAVEWFMRRGVKSRGLAAGYTYIIALVVIGAIGYAFIPTLVSQVNDFVQAVPGYVHDLTKGKGRLGFLETKYHIVEKIRKAVNEGGATKVLGLTGAAISITKSVISLVVATITIAFLTFFMLLEGPAWMERFYGLLPERMQPRWRAIGHDVYRTVGGYVTGNLLISLIAGTLTTGVLLALGVPFAVALGVIVAVLDLIPLAGATIAGDPDRHRRVPALDHRGDRRGRLLHRLPAAREPLPPAGDLRPDGAAFAAGGARLRADRRGARRHPRRARRNPGRRCDPGDPDRLAEAPEAARARGRRESAGRLTLRLGEAR